MSDTVFVKYYSIAFSILPGIAGGLALELGHSNCFPLLQRGIEGDFL